MSDLIFNEVDEELRRDRAAAFWKRYGTVIAVAAVLLVAVFAGWRSYQKWQETQRASAGDRLFAVIERSDVAPSADISKDLAALSGTGSAGTANLARFRLAADQARLGQPKDALASFDALSNDSGLLVPLRDMARLRAGFLALQLADYGGVESRVQQLAAQDNSYRHSARELLGLASYKKGNLAASARSFEQLVTDQSVPAGARSRGQMMIALLAADGMTLEKARLSQTSDDKPTASVPSASVPSAPVQATPQQAAPAPTAPPAAPLSK